MGARTDPRASGTPAETYYCHGRFTKGTGHCDQTPIDRRAIDDAILNELLRRFLDLDETRARLQAKRSADVTLAAEAVTQAETEAARASERLARVVRAFQDGHLEAGDYSDQRAGLVEERDAAKAAAERARDRAAAIDEQDDASEETLRRLAEIRAAVLGQLEAAPDLPAMRRLIGQLFESVTLGDGTLSFDVGLDLIDAEALYAAGRPAHVPDEMIGKRALDLDVSEAHALVTEYRGNEGFLRNEGTLEPRRQLGVCSGCQNGIRRLARKGDPGKRPPQLEAPQRTPQSNERLVAVR